MTDVVHITATLESYLMGEGYEPMLMVIVTGDATEQISAYELVRRLEFGKRRGFGSVKVEVHLGSSRWKTSVFPSKARAGWFLPIKKPVRIAESLREGDEVTLDLTLL